MCLAAPGWITAYHQVSLTKDFTWFEQLLLQRVASTTGAQRFPTRGVHDSLCPTDASQPEEASVKPTQIPPSTSDAPVLTNTPHHRSSEAAAMPVGPESDLPCSLSATGCGGITVQPRLSGRRAWWGSLGEYKEEFGFQNKIVQSSGDGTSYQV